MTSTAQNPLKKPVPSPFKADNTPSNECGFTLMNNQVGEVIADVMRRKPNVKVHSPLPSLIRVDGKNKIEVLYSEIDEAAGEEPGWFNQAEFEENMSTHYGRMVFLDDRALLFANPEDAAEYLGFDLVAAD
jgi:propane monooxygenase coupling protein